MRKSQATASSRPAPIVKPSIAAITGFRQRSADVSVSPHSSRSAGASVRNSATSPPALNALPPAPLITTTRTHSSASSPAKMPGNSFRMATVIVFIFGCRSIQRVATAPRRSTRKNSLMSSDLHVAAVAQQTAQDFARGGLGNLAHEDDAPGPLEVGQVGAVEAVPVERLAAVEARGTAGTTNATTRSPHFSSGSPMTATSRTCGMPRQDLLDLHGMDVLAAADDHVVDATETKRSPVVVDIAHVAGEVPAVAERLGVGVGTVPVAGECLVRVQAGDDLALLARRSPSRPGPTRRSVLAVDDPQRRSGCRRAPRSPAWRPRRGRPRTCRSRSSRSGSRTPPGRNAFTQRSVSAASMGAPAYAACCTEADPLGAKLGASGPGRDRASGSGRAR